MFDADEVYKFIEKIDKNTLIVIDGAYNEFAKFKDIKKFIDPKKYPNMKMLFI